METYKIIYQQHYPDADKDFRVAYVLANSFKEAQYKLEKMSKEDEYSSGEVKSITKINAIIIV
jgi:hypothetical protein